MKKNFCIILIVSAMIQATLAQDTIQACVVTDPLAPPSQSLYLCPGSTFGNNYANIIFNNDTFRVNRPVLGSGGLNLVYMIGTQGIMHWYCDRAVSGTPDRTIYFIGNPKPQICIITSDSNNHPVLFLDSATLYGNDPLLVQRQATNTSWITLDSLHAGSPTMFVDSTANTVTQAYTYRVKSRTCTGYEHTTIHLQANGNNLIWNEYKPNYPALRGYYIYKRDTTGNFSLIDSTAGLTYTDLNFNSGDEYFVEALKDGACPYANQINRMGAPTAFSVRSNRLQIGTLASISLSGAIVTETSVPVPGVIVTLSGGDSQVDITGTDGRYNFTVAIGGNYTITALKINDVTTNNGVTTTDILQIRRHVLNILPLPSPYKIIAADVDGSSTVTTVDILHTRSMILQISATFPNGRLWSFVPADYVFADLLNPFPFPTSRTYTNIQQSATNQDFIGIKLGDVNNSWDAGIP